MNTFFGAKKKILSCMITALTCGWMTHATAAYEFRVHEYDTTDTVFVKIVGDQIVSQGTSAIVKSGGVKIGGTKDAADTAALLTERFNATSGISDGLSSYVQDAGQFIVDKMDLTDVVYKIPATTKLGGNESYYAKHIAYDVIKKEENFAEKFNKGIADFIIKPFGAIAAKAAKGSGTVVGLLIDAGTIFEERSKAMDDTHYFYLNAINEIVVMRQQILESAAEEAEQLRGGGKTMEDIQAKMRLRDEKIGILTEHLKVHRDNLLNAYTGGVNIGLNKRRSYINRIDDLIYVFSVESMEKLYKDYLYTIPKRDWPLTESDLKYFYEVGDDTFQSKFDMDYHEVLHYLAYTDEYSDLYEMFVDFEDVYRGRNSNGMYQRGIPQDTNGLWEMFKDLADTALARLNDDKFPKKPDEDKNKPDEDKNKPDEDKNKPDEDKNKPDEDKNKPPKSPSAYSGLVNGYVQPNGNNSVRSRHTPDRFTVTGIDGDKKVKVTLEHNSVSDGYSFVMDPAKATGYTYGAGRVGKIEKLGNMDNEAWKILPSSEFILNKEKDFYIYRLESQPTPDHLVTDAVGYVGYRLNKTELPKTNTGISRYDMYISPHDPNDGDWHLLNNSTRLYVNWATGKVFGIDSDFAASNGQISLFIGDLDRGDDAQINGNYFGFEKHIGSPENFRRSVALADMKDQKNASLQLYGDNFANGIGGIFSITYDNHNLKETRSARMMLAGNLVAKDVTNPVAPPKNNDIWWGFATGVVHDTAQKKLDLAYSTDQIKNVSVVLRPDEGIISTSVKVRSPDGQKTYNYANNWHDVSVYAARRAFASIKDVNGIPSYLTTTMNESRYNLGSNTDAGESWQMGRNDYDYLAWGLWSTGLVNTPDAKVHHGSRWIAGRLTKENEMPKTGTAKYLGRVDGTLIPTDNSVYAKTIEGGDLSLTANFGTKKMTGSLEFSHQQGGSTFPSFVSAKLDGSIDKNQFSGDLSGSNINSGKLHGAFYGPQAQEVGGNWVMNADKWQGVGTFAGRKQWQPDAGSGSGSGSGSSSGSGN